MKKWKIRIAYSLFGPHNHNSGSSRVTMFLAAMLIWALFSPSRSSHRKCSVRKDLLRNFARLTGKHLCQSLFFTEVGLRSATLLKKRLWHKCFPVNFAKFLRTPFLTEHLRWLLLDICTIIKTKKY